MPGGDFFAGALEPPISLISTTARRRLSWRPIVGPWRVHPLATREARRLHRATVLSPTSPLRRPYPAARTHLYRALGRQHRRDGMPRGSRRTIPRRRLGACASGLRDSYDAFAVDTSDPFITSRWKRRATLRGGTGPHRPGLRLGGRVARARRRRPAHHGVRSGPCAESMSGIVEPTLKRRDLRQNVVEGRRLAEEHRLAHRLVILLPGGTARVGRHDAEATRPQ